MSDLCRNFITKMGEGPTRMGWISSLEEQIGPFDPVIEWKEISRTLSDTIVAPLSQDAFDVTHGFDQNHNIPFICDCVRRITRIYFVRIKISHARWLMN